MNILLSMGIGIATGAAAHQTDGALTRIFGSDKIGLLAHYAEGMVIVAGVFTLINRQHKHELTADKSLVDLILAAVSVGLGTLVGYMVDVWRGKK